MATTQEIIDLIVKPMTAIGYKIPTDEAELAVLVETYRKVLGKYTPHLIDEAMPFVFEKHSYTPKPADIVKAINNLPKARAVPAGTIMLTEGDPGFWPWIEYKFPRTKYRFAQGQPGYREIYVPEAMPPTTEKIND